MEKKESTQGIENLFEEIMTEKFPNLVKEKDIQVHKVQRLSDENEPKQAHTKIRHDENSKA